MDADSIISGGVWFTKGGAGFVVERGAHAHLRALSSYAKSLLPFYPAIISWVNDNPPPTSGLEATLEWNKLLASEFIREGWHLLWCGSLITNADSATATADLLNLDREILARFDGWPPETRIAVFGDLNGPQVDELLWGDLRKGDESGIDSIPPLLPPPTSPDR